MSIGITQRNLLHVPDRRKTRNNAPAMRCSMFAGFILLMYRLLNCQRRWRIGRILIHLAMRLEGGAMWSETAREIMTQFHGVRIGDFSYGNCFDPAIIPPNIKIGRYVSIAPGVRMIVQNHPVERCSTHPVFYEETPGVASTANLPAGRLEVGNDVWIGCNAVITPGCRNIGNGAVIGAGAIVTRDVPAYAIVAGNPAREIRKRFADDRIKKLQASRWWEQEPETAFKIHSMITAGSADGFEAEQFPERPIASIVIPAHNEEAVIGRCLRVMTANAKPGELEIIVVGNGCMDATCEIARGFSSDVRVIDSSEASKIAALNLGDRSANFFPRLYVDADVQLSVEAIRGTCQTLQREGIYAAAPRIAWDLSHSNRFVRAFYRVWRLQPYFEDGRLGSGVYAVNRRGHERLKHFPDVTADDEYVRRLFAPRERATDYEHCFVVTPPRKLTNLIKIKTRSRRGNRQLDQVSNSKKQGRARELHRLFRRVLVRPQRWLDFVVYAGVVAATSLNASRTRNLSHATLWEKDWSSRGTQA